MRFLRQSSRLARYVLAWFVLSLSVAIASPVVQPQATELICSAGGAVKLIVLGGSGDNEVKSVTLDCSLCFGPAALPYLGRPEIGAGGLLDHALQTAQQNHTASQAAAPLPARGPPSVL